MIDSEQLELIYDRVDYLRSQLPARPTTGGRLALSRIEREMMALCAAIVTIEHYCPELRSHR